MEGAVKAGQYHLISGLQTTPNSVAREQIIGMVFKTQRKMFIFIFFLYLYLFIFFTQLSKRLICYCLWVKLNYKIIAMCQKDLSLPGPDDVPTPIRHLSWSE